MGFYKSNQGFRRPEELYHPVFQGGISSGAVQYTDLYVLFRWNSDRTCPCAGGLVKPSGKNVCFCTGSNFQSPHYISGIRVLYLDVDDGTVLWALKLAAWAVWRQALHVAAAAGHGIDVAGAGICLEADWIRYSDPDIGAAEYSKVDLRSSTAR